MSPTPCMNILRHYGVKLQARPEGGIEPLCRQTSTGLKPAPQTTEAHPGDSGFCQLVYVLNLFETTQTCVRLWYNLNIWSLFVVFHASVQQFCHQLLCSNFSESPTLQLLAILKCLLYIAVVETTLITSIRHYLPTFWLLQIFDNMAIRDERVIEMTRTTNQLYPLVLLKTCIRRNFAMGDEAIKIERDQVKSKYSSIVVDMTVGTFSVKVCLFNVITFVVEIDMQPSMILYRLCDFRLIVP